MRLCFLPHGYRPSTTWAQSMFKHIKHEKVDTVEACDAVVCCDLTTNNHAVNIEIFYKLCVQSAGKPLLMFVHDDPETIMIPRFLHVEEHKQVLKVRLFRTSCLRSLQIGRAHV